MRVALRAPENDCVQTFVLRSRVAYDAGTLWQLRSKCTRQVGETRLVCSTKPSKRRGMRISNVRSCAHTSATLPGSLPWLISPTAPCGAPAASRSGHRVWGTSARVAGQRSNGAGIQQSHSAGRHPRVHADDDERCIYVEKILTRATRRVASARGGMRET